MLIILFFYCVTKHYVCLLRIMSSFRVIFVLIIMVYVTEDFVTGLENLIENEKVLVEYLEKYVKEQSYLLMNIIEQYQKFQVIYEKITEYEEYKNNPFIAYQLIRRLFYDWHRILRLIGYSNSECDVNLRLPSKKDVAGAAWGIVRLQEVYSLSTADIISKNIPNNIYSIPVTAEDCYTIAKQCNIDDNYVRASEWMVETLLQLCSNKHEDVFVDKKEVLEQLIISLCLSGDSVKAAYYLQVLPNYIRNSKIWYYLFIKFLTSGYSTHKASKTVIEDHIDSYQHIASNLCQQEFKYTSFVDKTLKCYYRNSYFAANIVKYKVEDVFLDPTVLILHDVITTSEIEYLKHYGRLYMKPARVYSTDGMKQVKRYRTSSNAWVTSDDSVSKKIEQRISAITGLSMVTAESLQISNYGIGGEYRLHYDMLGDKVKYLSDVKSGGSTVFPFLGLSVKPQKGSAVFWYNLTPLGTMDARTMHASCPVLYGNKWVLNKWIHEAGQEFIRPCPISSSITEYHLSEEE